MKEIKKERIDYTIYYEAPDGTLFLNREECEKYEESALGVLMAKYTPYRVRQVPESDIFGCGCDDSMIDIVHIKDQNIADTVLHIYFYQNSHLMTDAEEYYKKRREQVTTLINDTLAKKEHLFIGRGCDDDTFWIIGNTTSVLDAIKAACTPDPEPKEEGKK